MGFEVPGAVRAACQQFVFFIRRACTCSVGVFYWAREPSDFWLVFAGPSYGRFVLSQLVALNAGARTRRVKPVAASFGVTIFLSAFLLFWVQLLLGKYILPWFGGTPAVWTTCMLFFQVGLLGGYTYAHLVSSRLRPRAQGLLHAGLILACVLLLVWLTMAWGSPITPGPNWKPRTADHPVWDIIILLSASVGLPYFILSATGPLLQAWFARTHPGRSPYRLYALSNFGSILALFSYPLLLEPSLTLKTQAHLWWWAYLCFAAVCGYCALRVGSVGSVGAEASSSTIPGDDEISRTIPRPRAGLYALWISLAACASVIFLATTNQICQDIGVVPLLWVLPLGLYLLSFIVCFEKEGWYSRRWFHPLLGIAIFGACFVLSDGAVGNILAQIAIYAFVLFVCCMVCHGELVRSKPHPQYLTSFYLTVAAGGALGGVVVTLLAPHFFKGFWEYQLGLWLCVLLTLLVVVRDSESWIYRSRLGSPVVVVAVAALLPEAASLSKTAQTGKAVAHLPILTALILVGYVFLNRNRAGNEKARRQATPVYCAGAWLLLGFVLLGSITAHTRTAVALSRNFYGMLGVFPQNPNDPQRAAYVLKHGRVTHGMQFRAADKSRLPTSYYGPASGIGLAILRNPRRSGPEATHVLRIGGVGLGAGTIAAYGEPGDSIRFYEINPEVIRIATSGAYFTYLRNSRARVEVIPGDARLSMERELDRSEPQKFDVLAIDAFSGDAIPVHLLTEEAFRVYLKHLSGPQAIIAIHITNTYLDLRPVVLKLAARFGLRSAWISSSGDGETVSTSEWMLLSQSNRLVAGAAGTLDGIRLPESRLWTDDYSNLLQVLRR
jgi:hypothetical protein